jgi:hypothetical protein
MPSAWLGFMLLGLQVSHRCSLRASQGPLKGVNQGTLALYLRGAKLSSDVSQIVQGGAY